MSPIIIEPFSYRTDLTYYVHINKDIELAVNHENKTIYVTSKNIWIGAAKTFFSGDELRHIGMKYLMHGYELCNPTSNYRELGDL